MKTVRKEWKRCTQKLSEPAIHDIRVALRRLLFSLQLLQQAYPQWFEGKLTSPLKQVFKQFSDLRDLQVMELRISNDVESYRSLSEVHHDLEQKIQRQKSKLRKFFQKNSLRQILKKHRSLFEKLSQHPNLALETASIDRCVQSSFQVVKTYVRKLQLNDPESIHQLRIALKKYRYQMESYFDLMELSRNASFDLLHHYQTLLGDIHDLDVLIEFLLNWRQKRYGKQSRHLQRPIQHYRQQQLPLLQQLPSIKKGLLQLSPKQIIQGEVS
ncbi:MAG: CHAD domain-containing protein [bacterium]|nr:CHAD domain-containing protein [bacterium]